MIKTVTVQNSGARLDVYINDNTDVSRSYAGKLIEREKVTVNGVIAFKSGLKVKAGDVIEIDVPDAVETIEKKDIPFDIIYEDDDIAVINKPQGLTVHPASGNYTDTLVNALMFKLDNLSSINGEIRPGIVHRLDKDTSGIMIIAKNDKAHVNLSRQIADRKVKKQYLAIVEGNMPSDEGQIDAPIGRSKKDRKQMAVVSDGRYALTGYKVLERFTDNCLVLFDLHTGRTHQIRVHAKHVGHPIVGDPTYGFKKQKFNLNGQLLHAYRLTFAHPASGETLTFTAPVPQYLVETYNILAKRDNKRLFEQNFVDKNLQK